MVGYIIPKGEKTVKGSRIYNAKGAFRQAKDGCMNNARLLVGYGAKAVGLSLDLELIDLTDASLSLENEDYTITVTSKNPGAIGKAFFDLMDV